MKYRLAVVEDDRAFRQYLAALIDGEPGLECVGAHGNAEAALKSFASEKPDLVLLDVNLPGMSGLECLRELKTRGAKLDVIVLTVCDDSRTLFDALEAGATGYLLKPLGSSAKILEAIKEVRDGGSPMSSQIARLVVKTFHQRGREKSKLNQLTPREDQILALVTQGLQSKEIAESLKIQTSTIATHLRNIYEKLQVHGRAAAASAYARQHRA